MTRNSSSDARPKAELYADVTNKIVAAIEGGAATYNLPWHRVSGLPKNLASNRSYRGINTVPLWLIRNEKGYTAPYWATFKQWMELSHPVRQGEKSAVVVFWKQLRDPDSVSRARDGEGKVANHRKPIIARTYHVFNASQVEGLKVPSLTPLIELLRVPEKDDLPRRLRDREHVSQRHLRGFIHDQHIECFKRLWPRPKPRGSRADGT